MKLIVFVVLIVSLFVYTQSTDTEYDVNLSIDDIPEDDSDEIKFRKLFGEVEDDDSDEISTPLQRQIQVFELFRDVYHPPTTTVDNAAVKTDYLFYKSASTDFWNDFTHHTVPKNEIFSISSLEHFKIASALFKLFYNAITFDAFIEAAKWARLNVNPDLFIFAFTAAISKRADCRSIIVPAAYEINPYHYITADVIQKAQNEIRRVEHNNGTEYEITSEYSKYFKNYNFDDGQLSHFTNDVQLNAYYYNFQLDFGNWMNTKKTHVHRGSLYVYIHQQLIARYNLELLANGYDLVEPIDFDDIVSDGFDPHLRYFNGLSFPPRTNHWAFNHFETKNELLQIENRFFETIDKDYFETIDRKVVTLADNPDDMNILGNLLQANNISKNNHYFKSFERYAKRLMSTTTYLDKELVIIPGAIEQSETNLRDPLFYRLYARFLEPYYRLRMKQPHYSHEEMKFPGVSIKSIEMTKLETYTSKLKVDLGNLLTPREKVGDVKVFTNIDQHDCEVFEMNVTISSKKRQPAILTIFIGPKYQRNGEQFKFMDQRFLWFELDNSHIELVKGKNIITKSSLDFKKFAPNHTPFVELYKLALNESRVPIEETRTRTALPNRFILPKGRPDGFDVQFYFIVHKFEEREDWFDYVGSSFGNLTFSWPFDRMFDGSDLDNHMIHEAKVYSK